MPAFCLTAVQALVSTTTRNCGPAQRRGAWLPHGFVVIMVVVKQRPSMVLQVGQGVFFLLWPLFARAPRHWFLENFLLSAPGVQSVFFLLRSVGRRDLSAGPEQKKKTPPRVFFFLLRRRDFSAGPEQKKKKRPGWCFFFCCGPAEKSRRRSKKKKHPGWCFFFCSGPAERSRRPTERNKKKNTLHTRGRQQKIF